MQSCGSVDVHVVLAMRRSCRAAALRRYPLMTWAWKQKMRLTTYSRTLHTLHAPRSSSVVSMPRAAIRRQWTTAEVVLGNAPSLRVFMHTYARSPGVGDLAWKPACGSLEPRKWSFPPAFSQGLHVKQAGTAVTKLTARSTCEPLASLLPATTGDSVRWDLLGCRGPSCLDPARAESAP